MTRSSFGQILQVVFMLVLIAVSTARQYFGKPIDCWVPADFTLKWTEYTEHYCWLKSTYGVYHDDPIPKRIGEKMDRRVSYYQWMPFIFAVQAIFFILPHAAFHQLLYFLDPAIKAVNDSLQSFASASANKRKECEADVNAEVASLLDSKRKLVGYGYTQIHLLNRHSFAYVAPMSYLIYKVICIGNLGAQLYFMNEVLLLNQNNTLHVLTAAQHFFEGSSWNESKIFPKIAYCDFKVRILGAVNQYTVQCVLSLNVFYEKGFVVLWFILSLVAVAMVFNTVYWIYLLFNHTKRASLLAESIQYSLKPSRMLGHRVAMFTDGYVDVDGYFILLFVSDVIGPRRTAGLINLLWLHFEKRCSDLFAADDDSAEMPLRASTQGQSSSTTRPPPYNNKFKVEEPKPEAPLENVEMANGDTNL